MTTLFVYIVIRDLPFSIGLIRYRLSLFVGFVGLRQKSTAMVMAGRSVHLTTLFPG